MARALLLGLAVLFVLSGCNEGSIGDDDDDDTTGDDDDTDLGCNEPSSRSLGWDEDVEWWTTTAGEARDFYVGIWEGEIPWENADAEWMEITIGAPQDEPILTTYPDAEDAHALDACLPYATFEVLIDVALPDRGLLFDNALVSIEISEMTSRWDLYASIYPSESDCGGYPCSLSLGAWEDTTAGAPTLMARPSLTIDNTDLSLSGSDYAYLTHPDEPAE